MGVNIRELIVPIKKEISFNFLKGKIIAIDAYNTLYQFLSTIRQRDGTLLMDSKGNITSHLNGLFYRTINFLEYGIKPVYVFDGKPPELKKKELESRAKLKQEAYIKYIRALEAGDLEEARIYAQQTSRLTENMVNDAKELLNALGIPWIQAPSEGEAQAAYIVCKGDAWATASQDYDSLLFGSPRLVRNIAISGKRKLPRKNIYIDIKPEYLELKSILEYWNISREQLIYIGILLGTDFNPGGFKGIGIRRALKLVKEISDFNKIIKTLDKTADLSFYNQIINIYLNPEVTDNYTLEWKKPNPEKIIRLLVDEHDFSISRVENALNRAEIAFRKLFTQTSLETWFG